MTRMTYIERIANLYRLLPNAKDCDVAYVWFEWQSGGWHVAFIFAKGRWVRCK